MRGCLKCSQVVWSLLPPVTVRFSLRLDNSSKRQLKSRIHGTAKTHCTCTAFHKYQRLLGHYATFHNSSKQWVCERLGRCRGHLFKSHSSRNFFFRLQFHSAKKLNHVTPLWKDFRWLSVRQQLYLRFAVLVFKCMMGCTPEYLTSRLIRRCAISTRTTRNYQLLGIPLFRTASSLRIFQ